MCGKLMEACFEERLRLEPELRLYLPVVECSEEDLKGARQYATGESGDTPHSAPK